MNKEKDAIPESQDPANKKKLSALLLRDEERKQEAKRKRLIFLRREDMRWREIYGRSARERLCTAKETLIYKYNNFFFLFTNLTCLHSFFANLFVSYL